MYATRSEHAAHLARIRDIRDRWLYHGEITVEEKQKLIAEEIAFFRGDRPRTLTPARVIPVPDEDEQMEFWWQKESA